MLAALAYSRAEPGVWFINPTQWVTQHMFQPASIWDIPLVKPRFGCAFDISMAPQGYDVAAALEEQLGHFKSGSSCVRGFIHIHRSSLRVKASVEFGKPTRRDMPSVAGSGLRVSVVFYANRGVSPSLLDASISSVESRFPDAHEVVVVFTEPPARRSALQEVLKVHDQRAPFPVEAIEEDAGAAAVPARGGWPGWSGLRADDHATGDFVMQLEIGDILVVDVAYDNIFHFMKPVIPFQRLALGEDSSSSSREWAGGGVWRGVTWCSVVCCEMMSAVSIGSGGGRVLCVAVFPVGAAPMPPRVRAYFLSPPSPFFCLPLKRHVRRKVV